MNLKRPPVVEKLFQLVSADPRNADVYNEAASLILELQHSLALAKEKAGRFNFSSREILEHALKTQEGNSINLLAAETEFFASTVKQASEQAANYYKEQTRE